MNDAVARALADAMLPVVLRRAEPSGVIGHLRDQWNEKHELAKGRTKNDYAIETVRTWLIAALKSA